ADSTGADSIAVDGRSAVGLHASFPNSRRAGSVVELPPYRPFRHFLWTGGLLAGRGGVLGVLPFHLALGPPFLALRAIFPPGIGVAGADIRWLPRLGGAGGSAGGACASYGPTPEQRALRSLYRGLRNPGDVFRVAPGRLVERAGLRLSHSGRSS